jgi:hypothetical protein
MASIFDGLDNQGAESLMQVHGEPVVYLPLGGGSRSIQAIVDRGEVENISGGRTPATRIMVRNDATLGITSAEFDRGGDRITFSVNIGATATNRPAKQMPSQTAGMIILEVL